MPLRVVFDTNTVISALYFNSSRMKWLRNHWLDRECTPISSRATVAELHRVLSYGKFRLDDQKRLELLADYLPHCELIEVHHPCPIQCRDKADQPFLDLAYSAHAGILVTGDDDLLSLAKETRFAIESPATYQLRFPNTSL
jgi:putative PIN family toxin of toxin-antitoxin system